MNEHIGAGISLGLAAVAVPVRKAAGVDPIATLRDDQVKALGHGRRATKCYSMRP